MIDIQKNTLEVSELPLTTDPMPRPEAGKIAVIGAGLAGLEAARRLAKEGYDVTVFEAADRPGGRVHTLERKMGPNIELGGQLINEEQGVIRSVAKELNVPLAELGRPGQGRCEVEFMVGENRYTEDDLRECLQPMLNRLSDLSLDSMSLDELLRNFNKEIPGWAVEVLAGVGYAELGATPAQISAHEFVDWYLAGLAAGGGIVEDGYGKYTVAGGNSQLVSAMASELGDRLVTSSPLLRASSNADGDYDLMFQCGDGPTKSYRFDMVIFATPYSALRGVDLEGLGLSQDRLGAIAEMPYTNHGKVVGEIYGASGGANVYLDIESGGESNLGQDGEAGASWSWTGSRSGQQGPDHLVAFQELPVDEGAFIRPTNGLEDDMLERLAGKIAPDATLFGGGSMVVNWANNTTVVGPNNGNPGGAYAIIDPELDGKYPEGRALHEFGTNIYFAGEHLADVPGFMNSAIETGRMVADQIMEIFCADPVKADPVK